MGGQGLFATYVVSCVYDLVSSIFNLRYQNIYSKNICVSFVEPKPTANMPTCQPANLTNCQPAKLRSNHVLTSNSDFLNSYERQRSKNAKSEYRNIQISRYLDIQITRYLDIQISCPFHTKMEICQLPILKEEIWGKTKA